LFLSSGQIVCITENLENQYLHDEQRPAMSPHAISSTDEPSLLRFGENGVEDSEVEVEEAVTSVELSGFVMLLLGDIGLRVAESARRAVQGLFAYYTFLHREGC